MTFSHHPMTLCRQPLALQAGAGGSYLIMTQGGVSMRFRRFVAVLCHGGANLIALVFGLRRRRSYKQKRHPDGSRHYPLDHPTSSANTSPPKSVTVMTVARLFTRLRRKDTAQPVAMVRYLVSGAIGAVSDGVTGAFAAGGGIATPEPLLSDCVAGGLAPPEPVVSDCGAGGLAAVLVSFPPHVTQAITPTTTMPAMIAPLIQPEFELAGGWLTGRFGSFIVIEASILVAVSRLSAPSLQSDSKARSTTSPKVRRRENVSSTTSAMADAVSDPARLAECITQHAPSQ